MLSLTAAPSFQYNSTVGDKSPHKIQIVFGAPSGASDVGSSLTTSDLLVDNVTTGLQMPGFTLSSYNSTTKTAVFNYDPDANSSTLNVLPDGNYRAVLSKDAVSAGSNVLASDMVLDFFVLAGDIAGSTGSTAPNYPRDRTVDGDDLAVLTSPSGTTGLTYLQGNLNYDAAGTYNFSDLVLIAQQTGKILGAPATGPSDLSLSTLSPGTATIQWVDTTVGESGWRVEASDDGVNFESLYHNVRANQTSYTYTGLTQGKKYYFRVRAYSDPATNPNGPTTAYTPKKSVNTMAAVPEILSIVDDSSSHATITWRRNPSAAHYNVTVNNGDIYTTTVAQPSGTANPSLTVDISEFPIATVTIAAAGANVASGGTTVKTVAPPSSLSVSNDGSHFTLHWQSNSYVADGYNIERKASDEASWTAVASGVSPLSTSYADSGLTPVAGKWYQYRITPTVGGTSVLPSQPVEAVLSKSPLLVAPKLDTLATIPKGADGSDPAQFAYSADTGVRFADGTLRFEANDLSDQGLGVKWGVDRSWTNNAGNTGSGELGNGWMVDQRPFLKQLDTSTLLLILSGTDSLQFKQVGTTAVFRPVAYDKTGTLQDSFREDSITVDATNHELRLASAAGRVIRFFAFDVTGSPGGALKSVDGIGTQSYSSGRADTFGRNNGQDDERYAYSWAQDAGGTYRVSSIELQRYKYSTNTTTIARRVEYKYYDANDMNGNVGDLKSVTVFDTGIHSDNGTPSDPSDDYFTGAIIDGSYYRYYRTGDAGGYAGGLKLAFSPKSFARLAMNVPGYATSPDDTIAAYADLKLTYDAQHRVAQAVVQGKGSSWTNGLGTYAYSYTTQSGTEAGMKTVETAALSSRAVYTDASGAVRLDSLTDTAAGKTWSTYHEYDSNGRLTLTASPSAISTTYGANLLNDPTASTSDLDGLRDSAGLIDRYSYFSGTSTAPDLGSAAPGNLSGYLQSWSVARGESDTTGNMQAAFAYRKMSVEGTVVGSIGSSSIFSGTSGSGEEKTTYVDNITSTTSQHSGQVGWSSTTYTGQTISLPKVSVARNGRGDGSGDAADQTSYTIDSYGRVLTSTDAGGTVTAYSYDALTGAVSTIVVDSASSHLQLTTTYSDFDELGRPTKMVDPRGNSTYYAYLDSSHEVLAYPGLHLDASTLKTTGPVQMSRADYAHGYSETLSFAPSSITVNGSGFPTGGDTIGTTMTALKRSYEGVPGLVTQVNTYNSLSGVSYDDSVVGLGTAGTNYYSSFQDFDAQGRLNRLVNNVGTVTRYDLDGVGHVLSKWVGTGDNPATDDWSPSNASRAAFLVFNPATQLNEASTTLFASNMTKVESYDYDDPNNAITTGNGIGVGDGNVTSVTEFVGGTDPNRVTSYHYDWRDRLTAMQSGVGASTATTLYRPLTYYTIDNLGRATKSETFDGDSITSISYTNGVPDRPDSGLRRSQSDVAFDEQDRVYRERNYLVSQSTGVAGSALQTDAWYNARGDVDKTRAPGGLVTKYHYDTAGRLDTEYVSDGGGDAAAGSSGNYADAASVTGDHVLEQTEYTLDANGNVTFQVLKQASHVSTATGAIADPPARPTTATTHTPGSVARTYNYAYTYDAADRLTRSADIGANDGYYYDHSGTYTAPSRSADSDIYVTDYTYDAAGYNDTTTDPRGIVQQTSHDALGRATQTIEAYTDGVPSDGDDRKTTYAYDGNGNVVLLTAYVTSSTTQQTAYRYGISAVGTHASALFSNDLLRSVAYPDLTNGTPGPSEFTSYSLDGQSSTSTDRNGTTHTYGYDQLGRITSDTVTTFGSGVDNTIKRLGYGYDALGNTVDFASYSDTAGSSLANDVLRTYDSLGRITNEHQAIGSLSGDVGFTYDDNASGGILTSGGRLTAMTYPSGRILHYGYDSGVDSSISRLSYLADDNGSGSAGQTLEHLSYLGLSTPVVRSHPEALTDWSLAMKHTGSGTWTDPTSSSTLDRDDGDLYTGLDNHGRVAEVRYDATTSGSYFDSTQGSDGERDDFSYGYDADGNRLYRANNVDHSFDELYHANGSSAGYDKLNRLVAFARGVMTDDNSAGAPDTVATASRSQTWTLDALGNWKSLISSSGGDAETETRTHNRQNEVTTVTTNSGTATLSYSGNGELLVDQAGRVFRYDAWGRIVSVAQSAGTDDAVVYEFDALYRRISETNIVAGSEQSSRHYYYSTVSDVVETNQLNSVDSSETLQAQYVWTPSESLVLEDIDQNADGDLGDSGERLYVQADANNSVTSLVGKDATHGGIWRVVERYAYDAYGSPSILDINFLAKNNGEQVGNEVMFQSGRFDVSQQAYQFLFRSMQSVLGRWLTPDPLGYFDSLNELEFVKSNSATLSDRYGLAAAPTAEDPRVIALQAYFALSIALAIAALIQSKNGNVRQGLELATKQGLLSAQEAAAVLASHIFAKWLTDEPHIADVFGIPRKNIGDIIHEIKRNTPHEGNPNIEVDEATGDVRIKGTDEIIDNIKDYL